MCLTTAPKKIAKASLLLSCPTAESVTAVNASNTRFHFAVRLAKHSNHVPIDPPSPAEVLLQADSPARLRKSKSGKKTKIAQHAAAAEPDELSLLPQSDRPRKRAKRMPNTDVDIGLEPAPATDPVLDFEHHQTDQHALGTTKPEDLKEKVTKVMFLVMGDYHTTCIEHNKGRPILLILA